MTLNSIVTEYGLDALSAVLHETAIEKGFWDGTINHDKVGNKLALVHSEVTEVLEAIRNSGDLINSLDEILEKKININKERPRLHGNLF